MPSGDTQRTWFPEMIVRSRTECHAGMSMLALIGLRDELDGALQRIRAGRNIHTNHHMQKVRVYRTCGGTPC